MVATLAWCARGVAGSNSCTFQQCTTCAIELQDGLSVRTRRWSVRGNFSVVTDRWAALGGGSGTRPQNQTDWSASNPLNLLASNSGPRRPDRLPGIEEYAL